VLGEDMSLQFHRSLLFQQALLMHGVHAGLLRIDLERLVRDLGMSCGRRAVKGGEQVSGGTGQRSRVQDGRWKQVVRGGGWSGVVAGGDVSGSTSRKIYLRTCDLGTK